MSLILMKPLNTETLFRNKGWSSHIRQISNKRELPYVDSSTNTFFFKEEKYYFKKKKVYKPICYQWNGCNLQNNNVNVMSFKV